MKFNAPLNTDDALKILMWKIIKQTGWSIEYVDSLSLGKLYEIEQIEDGLYKAKG